MLYTEETWDITRSHSDNDQGTSSFSVTAGSWKSNTLHSLRRSEIEISASILLHQNNMYFLVQVPDALIKRTYFNLLDNLLYLVKKIKVEYKIKPSPSF